MVMSGHASREHGRDGPSSVAGWVRPRVCRRAASPARPCRPARTPIDDRGSNGPASPSSRDRQAHAVGLAAHRHLDAGGVAGVANGVRDRLLGEAVERGIDRRSEAVEVAGELDLDAGPFAGARWRAARCRRRPAAGRGPASSPWRRAPTIARISASVRDASCSMTASASSAAAGSVAPTTRPAWARMAMAETWWATVSWSSRASCSRSRSLT